MRRFDEAIAALVLLTRLPAAPLLRGRAWPGDAEAAWAYPLVGALVGAFGGAGLWLAAQAGLAAGLPGLLAIAAMLLLTGGLHEDGLADTADGFGGGRTPAGKLAIMRDSRIGSYGALALILVVAVRGTALAALPPASAVAALVAAGGLGRGGILVLLAVLRPARSDGTAATLRQVRPGALAAGLLLAAASAGLLPWRIGLACDAAALLSATGVAAVARRQVGGYTGDVLGAAAAVTECAVLCLA